MNKIKEFWKKQNHIKRGLYLGLLIGFFASSMIFIGIIGNVRHYNHPTLAAFLFNDITGFVYDISDKIINSLGCRASACVLEALALSILIYGIGGLIIGSLIDIFND